MPDEAANDSGLSESLTRMARIVLNEETLDAVLQLVMDLALRSVEPADAVSVSLVRDEKLYTAAYSNPIANELDAAQYQEHAGPCVAAIATAEPLSIPDIDGEERWPTFRDAAARLGVRSGLAIPLAATDDHVSGALNLYAMTVDAFSDPARKLAELFASQAAVLVANAWAFADANALTSNLRSAMESREMIGEAKGILIERHRVSTEEAFDILRRRSQTSNIKLRDVAAEIIRSAAPSDDGASNDGAAR